LRPYREGFGREGIRESVEAEEEGTVGREDVKKTEGIS
jgi:hypothetical protein